MAAEKTGRRGKIKKARVLLQNFAGLPAKLDKTAENINAISLRDRTRAFSNLVSGRRSDQPSSTGYLRRLKPNTSRVAEPAPLFLRILR